MSDNSHTKDTIKNYLESETSFALLITGKWGSGKTYFYENKIIPLAESIQLPNSPLFFLPVRVSLFGINSLDELESEVLATLYPMVKDTTLKAGANIAKAFAKGYIKNKFDVDIEKLISDGFAAGKKSAISKEHLLLCFDDLERKGKSLDIRQVIGYINSLVENNNSKVIILANEDQIEGDDYKSFKEKTIGISIEFKQNIAEIYDEFIFNKFEKTNPDYYKFLKEEKFNLLNILQHANSNLRIIIDGLNRIEKVFNEIQSLKLTRIKEATENALRFALGIHIEFKTGRLNEDSVQKIKMRQLGISDIDWNSFNFDTGKQKEDIEKDYFTLFREKYITDSGNYHFYESIYYFIVQYTSLDTTSLFNDVKDFFSDLENQSDESRTYRILSSREFGEISINDYKTLTAKLVKYAEQGKYGIIETVSTFYYATRLNNPLKFNKKTLANRLITGINKITLSSYDNSIDYQLQISKDHPEYLEMLRISKAAIRVNKSVLSNAKNQISIASQTLFKKDISEFLDYIRSQKGLNGSIFGAISPREFVSAIKNIFNYNQIITFIEFIEHSHYNNDIEESKKDISFFHKVAIILDKASHNKLNFQQKITVPKLSAILYKRIAESFREYVHEL